MYRLPSTRVWTNVRSVALLVLFLATSWGCATAGSGARNTAPAVPQTAPAGSEELKARASERFYKGKAYALAGDADCARLEFEAALDAIREKDLADPAMREFGFQLYDSIQLYRALTDGRNHGEERPEAEDPHDSLIAAAPTTTAQEVETARGEVGESQGGAFDIPMTINDAVLHAVAFFQFRTPQAFAGALQRSGRYLPLMRGILKEQGLPQDLVYVAMVESAFKNQAHSRKAAHGFWQFIEGTGRRYGLKRGKAVDERSDPIKSTRAAAAYFKDLYEMFGDWYLAMAAYDAGEGKILKGLQRTGARDFWELSAGSFLRRETRDYVPFVLAAALISKNPARFGFDVVPDPPFAYEVVELKKPVDLVRVAESLGAPYEELRLLNGELKGRSTPHNVASYALRVPPGAGAVLAPHLTSLPSAPETEERRIVVRKGDTVARLAARYKVSVTELCDWNDLPRNAQLLRGTSLVIPGRGRKETPARDAGKVALAAAPPKPEREARVRGEIRALPTPSSAITDASQVGALKSTAVTRAPRTSTQGAESGAGQSGAEIGGPRTPGRTVVNIPAEGFVEEIAPAAAPGRRPSSATAANSKVFYTVQEGDTLFSIAQKHGTTVDAIKRLNRIGGRALLKAGQRLTLLAAIAD